MTGDPRLVHLVTVGGDSAAAIIVAHLDAEGIRCELRRSKYDSGSTVGFGTFPVQVWVDERDYDQALTAVSASDEEVTASEGAVEPPQDPADDGSDDDDLSGEAHDLEVIRAEVLGDPSIPAPPAPLTSRDTGEDQDEISFAYARSIRPETRSAGPPPPMRRRRAIH